MHLGVPPHPESYYVTASGLLERREVEYQALLGVLLGLQPPPGHRGDRRAAQKSFGISEVTIQQENLLPFSSGSFVQHDDAGDHVAGNFGVLAALHAIDGQNLLLAGEGQIAKEQHIGIFAQRRSGGFLNVVRNRGRLGRSRRAGAGRRGRGALLGGLLRSRRNGHLWFRRRRPPTRTEESRKKEGRGKLLEARHFAMNFVRNFFSPATHPI